MSPAAAMAVVRESSAGSPADVFVDVRDVKLDYRTGDGSTRALERTNMTLRRGEFVAIVGPSGCGKSSLLKLASGLRRPTEGEIVVGGSAVVKPIKIVGMAFQNPTMLPWLRTRIADTRRIASICTGAFVLAAGGWLDGKRATTHWNQCSTLQALCPNVRIEPDAIYVSDPPFHTSAGVTAGIDLCLALVEADCGAATALAVARELVLFMHRPGGQAQFSVGLDVHANATPRMPAKAVSRVPSRIATRNSSTGPATRSVIRSIARRPAAGIRKASDTQASETTSVAAYGTTAR